MDVSCRMRDSTFEALEQGVMVGLVCLDLNSWTLLELELKFAKRRDQVQSNTFFCYA